MKALDVELIKPAHWLTPELARDWIKAAWESSKLDPPQASGWHDIRPFARVSLMVGRCDCCDEKNLCLLVDGEFISEVDMPEELIAAIHLAESRVSVKTQ